MNQTIDIPTSLYQRLSSHAKGFETPSTVIERLLNSFEGQKMTESISNVKKTIILPASLEMIFHPDNDEEKFKQLLLQKKIAYILLDKLDGTQEVKEWDASNFKQNSSVNGNLRSGRLRGWREKGIVKVEVSTQKSDLS
ncbi:MAG: hypothetical protein D3903_19865 [Candidatus Electrothrix sp. GM3_4]|nr:hypothetical protein [Candidatus Electrothrix sp. GM3_4]